MRDGAGQRASQRHWAEQFRTDGFLLRLQGAGGQMSRKHDCFVCAGSRHESKEATVYCFDCDNYFCGACNQVHLQLRGFDSHSTGVLEELLLKDMMTRRRAFCSVHTSSPRGQLLQRVQRAAVQKLRAREAPELPRAAHVKDRERKATDACDLKKKLEQVIKRVEDENEDLQDRETWMMTCAQQRREEIELAFSRIEAAVAERKARLLAEVEDNISNHKECHLKGEPFQTLVGTLKRNCALADEILGCGSDFDILESADDLARQCRSLHKMSQKESTLGADIRRTKSPVDSLSVNTLITMIGHWAIIRLTS
ncbi:uncharacterized protein LOC112576705 [Pomacea canaliculata]|uniref:uncharacterized protein LOC112576705 n=1 Tax=Pomacea canaliculata TaxID=400727 RepID=UPI000D729513|nr:uncharacterized protein LOC112576705 [Pomacea canaliculata]